MRSRITTAIVAGGMVLGAGLLTIAIANPTVAAAQEDSDSTSGGNNERQHNRHGAILEEVLAGLVADGTISQSQADDITEALAAKTEAVRAEQKEVQELIYGFLEDDVITADELAQLPDDHPFNDPDGPFAAALEDGELTRAEIMESRPHPGREQFKRGARFGALLDDGGIDQSEYDSLDEDHPLKQIDVSEYLEDGVITIDELREIRQSQSASGDSA
jgi:hypothetical protein